MASNVHHPKFVSLMRIEILSVDVMLYVLKSSNQSVVLTEKPTPVNVVFELRHAKRKKVYESFIMENVAKGEVC